MFCRKCGKSLLDGDRFCSYCGAQVIERRESLNINENVEEVVYNRAHFEEVAPRTEMPEMEVTKRSIAETWGKPELSRNTRPYWNLEGFPVQADEPRKTEDIFVDWEKRELQKKEPALRFVQEQETEVSEENEQEEITIRTKPQPTLSFATETIETAETVQVVEKAEEPVAEEESKGIDIFEIFDRQLEEEKKAKEKASIEDRGTMVFERQEGKLMLAEQEKERQEAEEEAAKDIAELEKEIFGSISSIERRRDNSRYSAEEQIDKFYTFSQKNEEFQRLLDREYERLKGNISTESKSKAEPKLNIEENHISANAEPAPTILVAEQEDTTEESEEDNPPKEAEEEAEAEKLVTEEEVVEKDDPSALEAELENLLDSFVPKKGEVSEANEKDYNEVIEEKAEQESEEVATEIKPEMANTVESEPVIEPNKDEIEKEEAQTEVDAEKEEKTALPWDDEISVGEFKVDEKKSSPLAVILGIIAALLVLEAALVGIKYFLPESNAAKFIDKNLGVAVNWVDNISKEKQNVEEKQDTQTQEENPEVSAAPNLDKNALIEANAAYNENIVQLMADDTLVFDVNKDYGDELINNSKPIENNIWYTDESGNAVLYDNEVVKTIIQFDSSWIDYVNGENEATLGLLKEGSLALENAKNFSKVGKVTKTFDSVRIGEIRQNGDVFFVWVKESISTSENGKASTAEYSWIYQLEPVDGQMKIVKYVQF